MHFFTQELCFCTLLFLLCPGLQAQEARVSVVTIDTSQQYASPDTATFYDKSFALVVGMSAYNKGWKPLINAASDADEVGQVLEERGFEVRIVKDLTKDELIDEMNAFFYAKSVAGHSRLLFYFAGHGHTTAGYNGQLGYVVPIDAPIPEPGSPGEFQKRAIDTSIFEGYAKATSARHVLFVFDSCFSGAILQSFRSLTEGVRHSLKLKVRQMITAGGANEEVPDVSIFKRHFIKGIRGAADLYKDNYVTGAELGYYLRQEVARLSIGQQNPVEGTMPTSGSEDGDFVFRVTESFRDSTDKNFIDWAKRRDAASRGRPKIKYGLLEIDSPYQGDFYIDGKLVTTNDAYFKTILLPDTYNVTIIGKQGHFYKEKVVISDGETTTIIPKKLISGF